MLYGRIMLLSLTKYPKREYLFYKIYYFIMVICIIQKLLYIVTMYNYCITRLDSQKSSCIPLKQRFLANGLHYYQAQNTEFQIQGWKMKYKVWSKVKGRRWDVRGVETKWYGKDLVVQNNRNPTWTQLKWIHKYLISKEYIRCHLYHDIFMKPNQF